MTINDKILDKCLFLSPTLPYPSIGLTIDKHRQKLVNEISNFNKNNNSIVQWTFFNSELAFI